MLSIITATLATAFATVLIPAGINACPGISNLTSLNASIDDVLAAPVAREMRTTPHGSIRAEKNQLIEANDPEARRPHDAELEKPRAPRGTSPAGTRRLAVREGAAADARDVGFERA